RFEMSLMEGNEILFRTSDPPNPMRHYITLQAEQYDWLADTNEEIDERVEAHYSYMAKIQEVPTADSGTDSEPLKHVQNDAGYNVFANDLQHSEQSESVSNTCLAETDDSNVIPDSPDMCENDIQNDQNDVESDDERVALANLKLDVDENKKIQKQLKKTNTILAQELKECKTILAKTSKTLGESISVRDSCLVALQNKQTEFEKYKAFNDRTIDYDKLKDLSKPVTVQTLPKTARQAIVQLILFIIDSGCMKHMARNLKLLCNFVEKFMGTVRFGNDQFAPFIGYEDLVQGNITINRVYYVEGLNHNLFSVGQFCDADLEVAFQKSTCFVRDLRGNDLLTSNRGSDLYTISLQESTSSTPLCLMAKASPTQAWLRHRRLSHLNFDYINLLSKKDIVIVLPKLKYVKDQLCYSCELSKAKISSFKSKTVPSSKGRLNLLHMDLCGPMRVASINEKKYIQRHIVLKQDTQCIFKEEGIEHQTSTAQTPEQNRVVERRNRTLVEEELHQFDRLQVWELVNKPFGKTIIRLKKLWKNKKGEDQTVIRNKVRLVAKGYAQEDGLQIHRSPRGIFINQAKYALEILHKHGMEKGQNIGTPMATKPKLDADLSGNPVDQTDYHADHARCIDTRKITSGGIQFIGDKIVSWMSKKQNYTAMSSAEAEYVALSP
nr:retrovirus-related Pol polyprotein from transposon TNT 1-94 [Tanacetum cinerariifolium]